TTTTAPTTTTTAPTTTTTAPTTTTTAPTTTTTTTTTQQDPNRFVVANASDSYGAGNGAGNYDPSSSGCWKSMSNFARQYAAAIGATFGTDVSCGGYTTSQIEQAVLGIDDATRYQVDLLFTSMGGNDAYFKDIVVSCFSGEMGDPSNDPNPLRLACTTALTTAYQLVTSSIIIDSTEHTLRTAAQRLPYAKIVLVGYPNLHVEDGSISRQVIDLLDAYTRQEAALIARLNIEMPGRFAFVDRRPLFAGHEVGSNDEWLNPIFSWSNPNEMYHPNPTGWMMTAGLLLGLDSLNNTPLNQRAKNSVVRYADGLDSWVVDGAGIRHPLLDGGSFECALAQQSNRLIVTSRLAIDALPLGSPAEVWCFSPQKSVGSILVDTDNHSWYVLQIIGSAPQRRSVGSEAAFRCQVNWQGRTVHRGIKLSDLNLIEDVRDPLFCLSPAEVINHVVVDPATNKSYVFEQYTADPTLVTRREIPDTMTFACLTSRFGAAIRSYIHEDVFAENVLSGPTMPGCLDGSGYIGKILQDPAGRQVLVTANGQRGVRDGGTSRCLEIWESRVVVPMGAAYIDSLPIDPAGWATCVPPVADGTIVRITATGQAFRKHTAGDGVAYLSPIAESETYRCLIAKGVSKVEVTTLHVEAFVIGSTSEPVCVNALAVAGKIVKGPGIWTGLVDAAGTMHAITVGGTYLCLTSWGAVPVNSEVFNQAQINAFTRGADATCTAHGVAAGKIVRAIDGTAIYVDAGLVAHPIRTGHAYQCLVEVGTAVLDNKTTDHLQAFTVGADQPGCEKVLTTTAGASYYQDSSGVLHSLRNTSSYYCALDKGYRLQTGITSTVLGTLTIGSIYPDCLSPSRYAHTMIRRSDGTVWVVNDAGQRQWVPDGLSYSCYESRGYRLAESNLTNEQATSLPEVGRVPYCLNPASFVNVMFRLADGTVYKTDGGACRYWVGNGWTYEALAERGVPLVADGLNAEHANSLPNCGTYPWMFSVTSFRNVLIQQANGTVWITDGNACRRWVQDWYTVERLQELGYGFKSTSAAQSEADSLPYCGTQPLMLAQWRVRNRVVRGPDGTAFFVTSDNKWHWIQTSALYTYLVNKYGLAGTWSWQAIDSIKVEAGWAGYW
ncbi:MAG: Triacylglycerol lipase Precursor, partial [Ilumatobacteraceae bacterium]|nr:Triacylglycerol lipase Precursor [Ilumatobacteraceae bacterium]